MRLIDNVTTTTATSDVLTVPRQHRNKTYTPIYVSITAAATVVLEGSSDPNLPFVPIETLTASTMKAMVTPRLLRVTITGNTGAVDVILDV